MDTAPSSHQNRLLSALTVDVQEHLFPRLERVSLPFGAVLHEPGATVRHIYFPIDSIVALVCETRSGASAEVSLTGNEGFIGVAVLLGGETTVSRAVVVSPGYAYRLQARHFADEFKRDDALLSVLLRYTHARIVQLALTAVCNRHHSIEQQLCRWLLLSLDRVPGTQLNMTHELIASMLGVRREGITEAACKLHDLGVIEYRRGHIKVLNRPRLEQLSCECYEAVKKETDRLLPSPAGVRPALDWTEDSGANLPPWAVRSARPAVGLRLSR